MFDGKHNGFTGLVAGGFVNQSVVSIVAQVLEASPFKGRVYQVGGAVRDELLGLPFSGDVDLVVEGDGVEAAQAVFAAGVASSSVQIYESFGTAMVMVGEVSVEFVGARKESYRGDSRKPDVSPATLLEDAQRRDFTVNALMRRLSDGALVDLTGFGLADLKGRVLRTPLSALETLSEDPLRIMRAVRFAAQLGFSYALGLEDAIRECAPRLSIISPERIQGELVKILALPAAASGMRDLQRLGVLGQFWPEFDQMVGVEQGSYHHLDVWDHTLLVLANAGCSDLLVSLGALFHDIGKPPTRFVDDEGHTRFFGHESVGAEMAYEMLGRLRFSTEIRQRVRDLVKAHMRLGTATKFSSGAARRLIRDMGEDLERLFAVVRADVMSLKPGVKVMDIDAVHEQVMAMAAVTPAASLESPLDGREMMDRYGLEPGPWLKWMKDKLSEAVLEGSLLVGDKEAAWVLADKFFAERGWE